MKHEIYLSFIITGFDRSPNEISQYLGVTSKETWLKGSPIKDTLAKHKENGWRLSSDLSKTETFETHLKALISIIEPHTKKIAEMCQKYHGKLFCSIYMSKSSEYSLPDIHFEKSDINFFSKLGIEIDFDMYFIP